MTRLGPHLNTTGRADIAADYIRRVQPDAVKMLSTGIDSRVVAAAQEVGALVIGRLYWEDQKLGAEYGRFIARLIEWCHRHPYIGWVEGANEFAQSPGELERYAVHEIDRMKALDAIGRKAVIGNFSCGTPDIAAWSRFKPALEYAAAHGHALGLHEYSGPVMQWMAGSNQWNNGAYTLTDPCEGPGVEGWLTLRYRKLQKLLSGWGIGHLKLAFTETGIDDVQPRPGPQGKGWKSYVNTEYGNMPPFGDYASQLAWYGRRLTEDPNVIAWVDFGFSQAGDWSTFDLSDSTIMRGRVIAEMRKLPRGHDASPTPPPPPPEVTMLQGIDVSRWQGAMDWSKAKAAGAVYAWIKASEGASWVDPQFAANARGAAGSGVLWGAYHYYRNGIDPLAQARHFAATVTAAGVPPTLTYALDFEDTTGTVDPRAMGTFAAEVERLTGAKPLVYTARWWWTPARLGGRQEWAARLPLWIADYSPESVPLPATGEWSKWTVLQYSSSGDGAQYGAASDRIDLNHYDGTRDALIAAVGYSKPAGIDLARLWLEARENQAIRLNPDSAIQRSIAAAGKVPVGNEWSFSPDEQAQLAESLAGTGAAVFVWDRRTGEVSRYNQP